MSLIVQNVIPLVCLASIPDSLKGMLKGVIKALELQKPTSYINLVGHWGINIFFQLFLGFHLNWHLFGLWCAKIILEVYIFSAYSLLIQYADWKKIVIKAKNRMEKEDILKENFSPSIGPQNMYRRRPDKKDQDFI